VILLGASCHCGKAEAPPASPSTRKPSSSRPMGRDGLEKLWQLGHATRIRWRLMRLRKVASGPPYALIDKDTGKVVSAILVPSPARLGVVRPPWTSPETSITLLRSLRLR